MDKIGFGLNFLSFRLGLGYLDYEISYQILFFVIFYYLEVPKLQLQTNAKHKTEMPIVKAIQPQRLT